MAGKLAVVLSGGGAKGAFQVGVLDQLITKRKVKVDIAVGTSTGSIQALAVAQDDLPKLIKLWTDIKGSDDIYRKRGGTFLAVINGKPSLYDASPLRALLEKNVDEARLRGDRQEPSPGVVNLTTGEFQSVGENAHQHRPVRLCQLRDAVRVRAADDQGRRRDDRAMGRRRGS